MAKNIRRMFAIFMVVCMLAAALPMQALAADGDGTTPDPVKVDVKVQTSAGEIDGTKTTTTTTTTTEGGTTTTTVTVTEAKKTETTGDPASSTVKSEVEYKETKTESVTTTDDKISESETVDGVETVTQTTTTTESSTQLVKEGKPVTETEEVQAGTLSGAVGAEEKVVDTAAPSTEGMDLPQVGDKASETIEDTNPGYVSNKDNPDVTTNADGSVTTTTTSTTTTVDTIVETTVTDVEVTDRELTTGGLTTESDVEEGEVETGAIVPVDGETTNVNWSWVDASSDEGKALIELAKKILNNQEIGEVSEADKAAAEALAAEAKKEDGNADVKALILGTESEVEPEISASITDVTLNVGEKVESDAANADEDNANDVYHAQMQFEVSITKNWLGTPVITIKQNGEPIATEYLISWNPSVKNEGDGNYTVQIDNLQLQEGEVSLDIKLEDVDELTTEKVFVATVDRTYTETKTGEREVVIENPDTTVDRLNQTVAGKNKVNDVDGNWDGSSAFTYEVTDADGTVTTITVTPGENNTLNISANHTIEMKSITLNTPFGTIQYAPKSEMLVKDQVYTIDGRLTANGSDDEGFASTTINNANQDKIQLQTAGNSSGKLSQIPDGDVIVTIDGVEYSGTMKGNGNTVALHTGNQRDNTLNFGDKVIITSKKNGNSVTVIIGKHESKPNQGKGTVVYSIAENAMDIDFDGGNIKKESYTWEETKTVKDGKLATSQDKQSVSLNMGMSFNFAVDEATVKTTTQTNEYKKTTTVTEEIVETVRKWYSSFEQETPVEVPGTPEEDPTPATWNRPRNQRLANDGVEIPEEPVPLAAPVITGDDTGLWIAFAMLVAFGMVAINLSDKKRNHEAF